VIADIPHPDHVTFADVDKDGRKDLLVADLGQFLPGDHTDGAMIWMRARRREVRRVLGRRSAGVADVEARRFQWRWQERSRRRRVWMADDRAHRHPRKSVEQCRQAIVHPAHH
jgi:hypothetical protein